MMRSIIYFKTKIKVFGSVLILVVSIIIMHIIVSLRKFYQVINLQTCKDLL
ncbi:hypothetical protein D3C86_1416110 [compost metagenome]